MYAYICKNSNTEDFGTGIVIFICDSVFKKMLLSCTVETHLKWKPLWNKTIISAAKFWQKYCCDVMCCKYFIIVALRMFIWWYCTFPKPQNSYYHSAMSWIFRVGCWTTYLNGLGPRIMWIREFSILIAHYIIFFWQFFVCSC